VGRGLEAHVSLPWWLDRACTAQSGHVNPEFISFPYGSSHSPHSSYNLLALLLFIPFRPRHFVHLTNVSFLCTPCSLNKPLVCHKKNEQLLSFYGFSENGKKYIGKFVKTPSCALTNYCNFTKTNVPTFSQNKKNVRHFRWTKMRSKVKFFYFNEN